MDPRKKYQNDQSKLIEIKIPNNKFEKAIKSTIYNKILTNLTTQKNNGLQHYNGPKKYKINSMQSIKQCHESFVSVHLLHQEISK